MKVKILTISIIAFLIIGGLALISCTNPCEIAVGGCGYSIDSGTGKSQVTVCANKDCIVYKAINSDDLDDAALLKAVKDGCDCK